MKRFGIRKILSILLVLFLCLSLAACAGAPAGEARVLKAAVSFAYPSLDVHKEYYGWYTSIYGLSETLFRMGDDSAAKPCLAREAVADGNTWTITLKDGLCFSNGEAVTADIVVKNLARAAAVNERFAYLAGFDIAAKDAKTLTIQTPDVYPTLLNDLASPELGIMDLNHTQDFDNAPICTGPFVIDTFKPEGDVTVKRNEKYWGGKVKLDGAVFYYMQEDEPKLMAMQNGEIDCYTSVSSAALEIFEAEPDKYVVTRIPATRLQFYVLNENRLSDNLREAVNLTVDKDAIAAFLKGTVSAAVGPFSPTAAYGKVTVPPVDTAKAKKLIEADGYALGADGLYQKDGQTLTLTVCYYAARSLDTLATLIQEQLKNVGVQANLVCEEDPDSTYMATGDYDLALYCMIADKAGDPYYMIDATLRQDSRYAIGGFYSDECEALIDQLQYETDPAARADLANRIVQIAIDDNAFGYVGLFNKTTVRRPGVSGYAETCPFDFYGIDKDSDIQ